MRTWTRISGSLLLVSALLVSGGCKKSDDAAETPADFEGAAESGVADDAAKAAIIGQWRIDSESSVELEGLDEAEADFVRAMAETVRAAVEFKADGTLTMHARVADSPVQVEQGTWTLEEVGMQNFVVEMNTEGSESPDRVTIEPQADEGLTMTSGEATLVLKKVDIKTFLADEPAAAPTEAHDAPDDAPADE